jgi:hypothetical protein
VTVQIVADARAGVIRAWFEKEGGAERTEIGTFSLALARRWPQMFQVWQEALAKMVQLAYELGGTPGVKVLLAPGHCPTSAAGEGLLPGTAPTGRLP